MQTNMKISGLTSIFQVCIVHFPVFWGPGKFGLNKGTGGDPPPPQGDIVTFFYRFFYCGASLRGVCKIAVTVWTSSHVVVSFWSVCFSGCWRPIWALLSSTLCAQWGFLFDNIWCLLKARRGGRQQGQGRASHYPMAALLFPLFLPIYTRATLIPCFQPRFIILCFSSGEYISSSIGIWIINRQWFG